MTFKGFDLSGVILGLLGWGVFKRWWFLLVVGYVVGVVYCECLCCSWFACFGLMLLYYAAGGSDIEVVSWCTLLGSLITGLDWWL